MAAADPATDPELERLQQLYGEDWRIRRTESWWWATARDAGTTSEPTIIADTAEQLERRLDNPGPRVGNWDIGC